MQKHVFSFSPYKICNWQFNCDLTQEAAGDGPNYAPQAGLGKMLTVNAIKSATSSQTYLAKQISSWETGGVLFARSHLQAEQA